MKIGKTRLSASSQILAKVAELLARSVQFSDLRQYLRRCRQPSFSTDYRQQSAPATSAPSSWTRAALQSSRPKSQLPTSCHQWQQEIRANAHETRESL